MKRICMYTSPVDTLKRCTATVLPQTTTMSALDFTGFGNNIIWPHETHPRNAPSTEDGLNPLSRKSTIAVVQLIPEDGGDWRSFVDKGGLRKAVDVWIKQREWDEYNDFPSRLFDVCMSEQRKRGLAGRPLAVALLRQMAEDAALRQRCMSSRHSKEASTNTSVYRTLSKREETWDYNWKTAAEQVGYYCEHPGFAAAMGQAHLRRRELVRLLLSQYSLSLPSNIDESPAYRLLLGDLIPSVSSDEENWIAWKVVDEVAAARYGNPNAVKWLYTLLEFRSESGRTSLKIQLPQKNARKAVAPLQTIARELGFEYDDEMKGFSGGQPSYEERKKLKLRKNDVYDKAHLVVYKRGFKPAASASHTAHTPSA